VRRRPVSGSGQTRSSVLPWATAISCEETDPDLEAADFFESRTPPPPAEGAATVGEDLAASSPAAGAELPQAAQDGMKRKELGQRGFTLFPTFCKQRSLVLSPRNIFFLSPPR
jgi:hypothetical protein